MARMGSSRVTLLAAAILAFAGFAVAQQFTYTTISIPGSTQTVVYGINDFGAVVGNYDTDNNRVGHGFMRAGGKITNLAYPGAQATTCYAINNSGEVVGQYLDTEGVFHAFSYQNGTYTNIDPPGAEIAAAAGINNVGAIVGSYYIYPTWYAFLLSGTTYQTLSVPGASNTSSGGGINDSDQVTLQWEGSNGSFQSSIYDGTNYTQIVVAGTQDVYAYGINNAGTIVLLWQDEESQLLQAGLRVQTNGGYKYPLIEDPLQKTIDSTRAYGISNTGLVVGYYGGPTGALGFAARGVSAARTQMQPLAGSE